MVRNYLESAEERFRADRDLRRLRDQEMKKKSAELRLSGRFDNLDGIAREQTEMACE